MPETYSIGDLVWAKMKSFSPWPGRVTQPRPFLKKPAKRNDMHCIYFFGTHNFAWIEETNIKPYVEFKAKLIKSCKTQSFKDAVDDIEDFILRKKEEPDYNPDLATEEDDQFNRLKDAANQEKTDTPKPKKKSGIKRIATAPVPKIASAKKNKRSNTNLSSTTEENGASPPYGSNHVTKNYEELLNRPSIIDRPDTPIVDINDVSDYQKNKNISASSMTFGFLGLGIMGSGMVKNLINSGHKVNLWSRTPRKCEEIKTQADAKKSGLVETYSVPCDVVENSHITFCCVTDPRASKDIVFGNCGVLHQADGASLDGKAYVEMTGIDSETSKDICNVITSRGGRYLEAQIQGSKKEADEGSLIILAAGDKTLFDDCQMCFKAIGKTAFYLGEVGYATKMNLVLQVMNGIALAGVAEGFALADRSGLSQRDVLEIFSLTNLSCPYLHNKAELIVSTDFQNCQQPLQHMQKDMKLALELADSLNQPLVMAATANEVFKHARRLGYEKHDSASVYMRARL